MPIPFIVILGALLLAVFNVISWTAFWITTGVVAAFTVVLFLLIVLLAALGASAAVASRRW